MKKPEDMTQEELRAAIDENAADIGLTIAALYKTVTMAVCHLPNMELHTESICLSVNDDGISVHIGHPGCFKNHPDGEECLDQDFGDDEEERIYDEF